MSAVSASTDRNLLFGVLALQMGFVTRDALIEAMVGWVADKGRPLGRILIDRGALVPDDAAPIELAVRRHLARHGDAARCLTAPDLGLAGPALDLVDRVGDDGLRASLAPVASRPATEATVAPDATTAYADPPLDAPAVAAGGPASAGSRYLVLRSHAKGGLGEVFVAWDHELGRQVALKEIRPDHAHDPGLRARFVREAEVNGNLEHPGIVPVHGMGTHPDGRPYYAMRFVDGETFQDAIDRFHGANLPPGSARTLGLRELLRRFVDVCEAIAYAHSKGVIHRDLKPSNVMLGPFGETLIIDWGLAKVVGRDDPDRPGDGPPPTERVVPLLTDSVQLPTVVGETLGSPPYMSPEQARGRHDELGRASDVYSLGATLYTVLTGKPPAAGRPSEVLEKVIRGAITPPAEVDPRVPRALDAICREAMRLDPADRYESARDLAHDLERWMAGEAVAVHRDSPISRLFRWSRRHKSFVAASLGLLLATLVGLAVGIVVVGQQRSRAERALVAAEVARGQAREHLRVGLDLVDQLVTFGDRQLIAQQPARARGRFLRTAKEFLRRFREHEPDAPEVQRSSGMIARRLANLYRLIGDFDQAEPLYVESVAILSALHDLRPDSPQDADLLAETLADQAEARLAFGRPRDAGPLLDRALEIARHNARDAAPTAIEQRTLARVLAIRGAEALALGRPGAARIACTEAVDRITPLAEPALSGLRTMVAEGRYNALLDQLVLVSARIDLAGALDLLGEGDEAEDQRRMALDRMDRVAEALDGLGIPDVDHFHAWAATRLARALAVLDEPGLGPGRDRDAEARDLLDDAVARLVPLVDRHGDLWQFRTSLADARAARARLLERAGEASPAESDARAARALLDPMPRGLVPVAEAWSPLADALETLALVTLRREPGDPDTALELLRLALDARRHALDARPDDSALDARLASSRSLLDSIATDDTPTPTDAP